MLIADGLLSRDGRPADSAFRLPAIQMGNVRAFGDLKYGQVNPARSARGPIKLAHRDHIGKIRLGVAGSDRE